MRPVLQWHIPLIFTSLNIFFDFSFFSFRLADAVS